MYFENKPCLCENEPVYSDCVFVYSDLYFCNCGFIAIAAMSGGRSIDKERKSPRESGEDSEDESEILEESPCGRWLKRREEVSSPHYIILRNRSPLKQNIIVS